MANMAILAVVTLVFTTRRLLQRAALENVLSAMLAVTLTALALVFATVDSVPSIGGVGLGSVALACAYFGGSFAIRERQESAAVEEDVDIAGGLSLLKAQIGFVVAAAAILAAAPLSPEAPMASRTVQARVRPFSALWRWRWLRHCRSSQCQLLHCTSGRTTWRSRP